MPTRGRRRRWKRRQPRHLQSGPVALLLLCPLPPPLPVCTPLRTRQQPLLPLAAKAPSSPRWLLLVWRSQSRRQHHPLPPPPKPAWLHLRPLLLRLLQRLWVAVAALPSLLCPKRRVCPRCPSCRDRALRPPPQAGPRRQAAQCGRSTPCLSPLASLLLVALPLIGGPVARQPPPLVAAARKSSLALAAAATPFRSERCLCPPSACSPPHRKAASLLSSAASQR